MDISEGAGRSEESVDRLVESSSGQTILLGSQLRIKRASIEENRCLLKGDCSLATRHSCQRIEPFEVDAEASVGRKETPLDEIELIVITQK